MNRPRNHRKKIHRKAEQWTRTTRTFCRHRGKTWKETLRRLLDGLFCVSSNRNCTGDGETSLKSRSPFYAPGLIMYFMAFDSLIGCA